MKKSEIIEKLKPKCNGHDLPLSLDVALVAEILTESNITENDGSNSEEQITACDCIEPNSEDNEGNKWCNKCYKMYHLVN